jgi:hypothetical protein
VSLTNGEKKTARSKEIWPGNKHHLKAGQKTAMTVVLSLLVFVLRLMVEVTIYIWKGTMFEQILGKVRSILRVDLAITVDIFSIEGEFQWLTFIWTVTTSKYDYDTVSRVWRTTLDLARCMKPIAHRHG